VTSLWRVTVRRPHDRAEKTRAAFVSLARQGFEERDVEDGVELTVYADGDAVETMRALLPDATIGPVEDGWEDAWRAFHRPVEVAGIWVGPPWESPPDPSRAVVIDPGRAFGTGAHATTRLCIELLAGLGRTGSLLDVGCGSGVLGIAAARLGFAPITCVDVDPVAVETTTENAAANGVELEARVVDALTEPLPAADVAVANVLLDPVAAILLRLDVGVAITSGYLQDERPAHPGWSHVETATADGWAADGFRRLTVTCPTAAPRQR
jgi:ribosomal protein L11 methyltransferase